MADKYDTQNRAETAHIFKTQTQKIMTEKEKNALNKLNRELLIISNKARFIKDIIDGKLKVNNVPKKTIVLYLETANYDEVDGSYNYLLNMPIYSLTKERFEELLTQKAE